MRALRQCRSSPCARLVAEAPGRTGEPEGIANAVAFPAAPESGWITARALTGEGGRMDCTGHG